MTWDEILASDSNLHYSLGSNIKGYIETTGYLQKELVGFLGLVGGLVRCDMTELLGLKHKMLMLI